MAYYDLHIFCCTNRRPPDSTRRSCAEGGSEELRDYMKAKVKELGIRRTRVNTAGCLDRCELGPCMVIYPAGVWYGYKTQEDIDEIIASHLGKGEIVARLRLPERGESGK